MRSQTILWSFAVFFALSNILAFFFILGGSNFIHVPIPYAIFVLLTIIASSGLVFSIGLFYNFFLRKGLNAQQFFLITAVYIISFLPNFLFFIRRFQNSFSDNTLNFFAKYFNFLYIEMVILIVLSIITINFKYRNDIMLLILSIGISAIISQNAPISFTKDSQIISIFIGKRWLLPSMGFSLCLISLGLYLMNLKNITFRNDIVLSQTLFLFGFLLSMHIILILSISFFLLLIFSAVMVFCLLGYLRGVFVHTL